MKTNTLVVIGFVGASLAGCEIRCLSPRERPASKTQTTYTGTQTNALLVDYQAADTRGPGESPIPSDADVNSNDGYLFRKTR